jgi:hypothetical protein
MFGQFSILNFFSYGFLGILAIAFWIWMLIDCIRNEPDRYWIWIIFMLSFLGAVIYFLARRGIQFRMKTPKFLNPWLRRNDLIQAEAAVQNIGNVYQYVKLGDLLMEQGKYTRALEIYRQGLERDEAEKPALWGAAQAEMKLNSFGAAKSHLEELLKQDASYRFGESSLALGRALVELGDYPAARTHLEKHLDRWYHLEGRILLARTLKEMGEPAAAQEQLKQGLDDYRTSPAFNQKQNRVWAWRAKLMLRSL